jgi:hypothetical protein
VDQENNEELQAELTRVISMVYTFGNRIPTYTPDIENPAGVFSDD